MEMKRQNNSLLRETRPHGNSFFPFMLYDMVSDMSFEERIGCHWHEEIELLVITKGEASIHLNDEVYPVKEDSICIIPSNHLHLLTCGIGKSLDFFAIVFHPDFIRGIGDDGIWKKYLTPFLSDKAACRVIQPSGVWEGELLQGLQRIRDIFHAKEYAYELLIKIRLLDAFYLLAQHAAPVQGVGENMPDHHVVLIKAVMEYLRAHYDNDITLAGLEKEFGISREHLCRLFKAITHMTPFAYLNYCRINQSVDFLAHSDDNISTVAIKSGFNNISYYNRTFQKYMHMTPSAFRKSLCEK